MNKTFVKTVTELLISYDEVYERAGIPQSHELDKIETRDCPVDEAIAITLTTFDSSQLYEEVE